MKPEELIHQSLEQWENCAHHDHPTLLRLSLLRDILRKLHSDRSRCLVQGLKLETADIRDCENKIEALKDCSPLEGDLLKILSGEIKCKKKTRLVPEKLWTSIEREKLERYDRHWEFAIASEALSQGWKLWNLETEIPVATIEEENRKIGETLWPTGIVLFAETVSFAANSPNWHGRWLVVMHPDTSSDSMSSLGRWKLLFSPRLV